MASSATEQTGSDEGELDGELPATVERTVERLDQGIVITYELGAETDEAVPVDLTQAFPPELTVADVGFRTDAAPPEWSVDEDTVRGSGTVEPDGGVEYVLGLKLPESPEELPTFPDPELSRPDAVDPEAATDAGDEGVTDPADVDLEADEESTEESTDEDGPELVGNTEGALAESVRQVIGNDDGDGAADAPADTPAEGAEAPDDRSNPLGTAATDGGAAPAPRDDDDGSGLEAAVAAVESELDEPARHEGSDEPTDEEPPELDLSAPDTPNEEAERDDEGTAPDAAPPRISALAEELAEADTADRRAVREALDLDEAAPAGTVSVRLEKIESRLSAFEAYEDALAAFIDDTGTVEEIETTASEAAAAADDLRDEVADLREEVTAAHEAAEAAQEALETAAEERAALREDVAALREDLDAAEGLRQQLLTALQNGGPEPANAD